MNLLDFPGCCTAEILTGFGQTGVAEYAYRPEKQNLTHFEIAEEVFKKMAYARRTGNATIIVTLNSEQKTALEVLREMKWHVSPPLSKRAHAEHDLHVCYCELAVMVDDEKREQLAEIVAGFA